VEHKKHARLPDDLKQKAVLLAKAGDLDEVARAIKIAPHRLDGWVERFSAPANDSNDRASVLAPFIDVTGALMPPASPPQAAEAVSIDVMVQGRGSLKIAGALDAATIRFIVSTAFGSTP
jgi:transposase-like protein